MNAIVLNLIFILTSFAAGTVASPLVIEGLQHYGLIKQTILVKTIDDGVPNLTDYNHPVVNGKSMDKTTFLHTYCDGKFTNKTCVRVHRAWAIGL